MKIESEEQKPKSSYLEDLIKYNEEESAKAKQWIQEQQT